MQDVFDISTIVLLAVAVLIFIKLRSVLGQRTGRERPPYDPYSAPDPVRNAPGDKVIPLPQRTSETAKPAEPSEPVDRYAGIAMPGSAVAKGLDAIMASDETRRLLGEGLAALESVAAPALDRVNGKSKGSKAALFGTVLDEVIERRQARRAA